MKYKKELSRENKGLYIIVKGIVDGSEIGSDDFEMSHAETPDGLYMGGVDDAKHLCDKRGIRPELAQPEHNVCSIGFQANENRWYGWSHRAIYGFAIGDVVSAGDSTNSSGWTDEYLEEHPDEDTRLPVGFTAHTLDDARKMAVAFAESVS